MAVVQRRIGAIFAPFFLLLVLAAGRTVYLGVLQGGALRKAARSQQLTDEPVPAQRGTITDRNGVDLAVSEPAQDISATPYLLTDPLARGAAAGAAAGPVSRPRCCASSPSAAASCISRGRCPASRRSAVLALKIPGIAGAPVMRRVYPRGTLAAQVLGVVGTEGNGLAGLEYSRNTLLHGRSGQRRVVSDAIGQPVSITEAHPEMPGASLSLTLDANIQQRTEEVLGAVGRVFNPKDATAIVMDPQQRRDPRDGQLAAGERQRPRRVRAGSAGEPRGGLRLRTGLDVQGGHRLRRAAAGADHAEHGFDIPDQIQVADRTIHDDTEHAEETPHHRADPGPVEQRRRDQDRHARGRVELQRLGAPVRLRSSHAASSCPARKGAWCCR